MPDKRDLGAARLIYPTGFKPWSRPQSAPSFL